MTLWQFKVVQQISETIEYDTTVEAETEVEARGEIEQGDWDDTRSRIVRSRVNDQTETLVSIDGEPVEPVHDDVYDERGLRRIDAPLD